jgi:hypothetical protein
MPAARRALLPETGRPNPRSLLGDFETALWLPHYREGQYGGWAVSTLPVTAARGYWGGLYRTKGMAMLSGPFADTGAAWMSMVPMEIQSQEIGIKAARGHTVVLGLGMGWCAANVALNPAVEHVTVVERDPEVVALIEALGVFDQLPEAARAKIELVLGNALAWRPNAPVDSLQADIWAKFVEPGKWADVQRMQDNIGATSLYFWGQELELWRLVCRARDALPRTFSEADLTAAVAETRLPLILDHAADYPAQIQEAAHWWTPAEDGWWHSA